ncbi:hypothetical protein FGRA07_11728, partial [Fusarium graminearum]
MKTTAERSYELGRLDDPKQLTTLQIAKPKRPSYSDYKAKEEVVTGPRSSVPTHIRGDRDAESYNELLAGDQEAFKPELNLYRMDREEYNKQNDVFSAHFRQEVQDGKVKTEKEKPARIAKGSFGPTFRASSSESTKRTSSGPPLSRENSAKRPRQSIESGEKGE